MLVLHPGTETWVDNLSMIIACVRIAKNLKHPARLGPKS